MLVDSVGVRYWGEKDRDHWEAHYNLEKKRWEWHQPEPIPIRPDLYNIVMSVDGRIFIFPDTIHHSAPLLAGGLAAAGNVLLNSESQIFSFSPQTGLTGGASSPWRRGRATH